MANKTQAPQEEWKTELTGNVWSIFEEDKIICFVTLDPDEKGKVYSHRIVTAVNAHDDMKEAIRTTLEGLRAMIKREYGKDQENVYTILLKNALDKANSK